MSAELTLVCQRIGCDEVETIDLHGVEPGIAGASHVARVLDEDWPEGWGWDHVGVDDVLHCAEHRS